MGSKAEGYSQSLIRRDRPLKDAWRIVRFANNFIAYPEHWPPYWNGGIQCTSLQGPCDCGAWHSLDERQVVGDAK